MQQVTIGAEKYLSKKADNLFIGGFLVIFISEIQEYHMD